MLWISHARNFWILSEHLNQWKKNNHDTCHVYSGDHRADTRDSRVQWPGQARDIGHWEWVSNNKSSLASSECCYNYHVCLCLISGDTPDSGHQTPDSVSSPYPLLHSKGSLSTAGCAVCILSSVLSSRYNTIVSQYPLTTYFLWPGLTAGISTRLLIFCLRNHYQGYSVSSKIKAWCVEYLWF